MKRWLMTLVILAFWCSHICAQSPIRVKHTYVYHGHHDQTIAEAERIALERTKIEAIEKTFGVVASETTSGIMSSQLSENLFSAHSSVSVKGEWIQTIGTPEFIRDFDDRAPVITCTIEGYVKEIQGMRADYEVEVLKNSPNVKFASRDFSDGDDMYLYFKSPVGGFLNVYLLCHDDDTALCLLPYRESNAKSFRIDADKDYYLFSKDKASDGAEFVDEYTLTTERANEANEIVIVFSPDDFVKPKLKVNDDEMSAIKETTIDKFNSWHNYSLCYLHHCPVDGYKISTQAT